MQKAFTNPEKSAIIRQEGRKDGEGASRKQKGYPMTVTAINSVNVGKYNNVSFGRREETPKPEQRPTVTSSLLKSVPLAAIIALSPMTNVDVNAQNINRKAQVTAIQRPATTVKLTPLKWYKFEGDVKKQYEVASVGRKNPILTDDENIVAVSTFKDENNVNYLLYASKNPRLEKVTKLYVLKTERLDEKHYNIPRIEGIAEHVNKKNGWHYGLLTRDFREVPISNKVFNFISSDGLEKLGLEDGVTLPSLDVNNLGLLKEDEVEHIYYNVITELSTYSY